VIPLAAAAEAAPAAGEAGGLLTAFVALSGAGVLAWLLAAERSGRSPLPRGPAEFRKQQPGALLLGAIAVLFAYNLGAVLMLRGGSLPVGLIGLLVIVLAGAAWAGGMLPRAPVPRCRPARLVGIGLLVAWAALPIVLGTLIAVQSLTSRAPQPFVEDLATRKHGWGWIVVLALAVAPVMEEITLRGLLYPALRRWWGPRAALVVTSVAFGLMHIDPPSVWAPLAILGAFFCWTVERTGSIVPAIVGHIAFNGLSVLQLLFAGG